MTHANITDLIKTIKWVNLHLQTIGHMQPQGWLFNYTNVGMARKKSSYYYKTTKNDYRRELQLHNANLSTATLYSPLP